MHLGFDHITTTIGIAISASIGCDFLCYVTPAEHLALPNEEDVIVGEKHQKYQYILGIWLDLEKEKKI